MGNWSRILLQCKHIQSLVQAVQIKSGNGVRKIEKINILTNDQPWQQLERCIKSPISNDLKEHWDAESSVAALQIEITSDKANAGKDFFFKHLLKDLPDKLGLCARRP